MDEQINWFLVIESTSKDVMNTVEMTIRDLEYHIYSVDKTAAGFED